jgi:hypothetical protein
VMTTDFSATQHDHSSNMPCESHHVLFASHGPSTALPAHPCQPGTGC